MSHGTPPIQPTNPYHIARAYGLQPAAPVSRAGPGQPVPVEQVRRAATVSSAERVPSQDNPGISRLVGGRVPGGVDFSGGEPIPKKGEMIIPFYRHPADRNAAATNIQIGRTLDVNG